MRAMWTAISLVVITACAAQPPRPAVVVGPAEAEPTGLDALLTPIRAAMLRHISAEHTMAQLAAHAVLTPSATTYHVDALVAAGLVVRRRRGRQILVRRTRRGTSLVQLYDHE